MDETQDPCIAFGQRLRQLRRERGVSQENFAKMAGLDRTYISSAEAGRRNVSLKTIYKLAGALGVEAAELMPRIGEVIARP